MTLWKKIAVLFSIAAVASFAIVAAPVTTIDTNGEPRLVSTQLGPNEYYLHVEGVDEPTARAMAGDCTWGWLCGVVHNEGRVDARLIASYPDVFGIHLPPGWKSDWWYKDTDGVYLYAGQAGRFCGYFGCETYYGPARIKLQDSVVDWDTWVWWR